MDPIQRKVWHRIHAGMVLLVIALLVQLVRC